MSGNLILWIAAVTAIFTAYQFRNRILERAWRFYLRRASNEQLEKAVRLQYEAYERDRRSFSLEGLAGLAFGNVSLFEPYLERKALHCQRVSRQRLFRTGQAGFGEKGKTKLRHFGILAKCGKTSHL